MDPDWGYCDRILDRGLCCGTAVADFISANEIDGCQACFDCQVEALVDFYNFRSDFSFQVCENRVQYLYYFDRCT
eukprot:scaffold1319_cov126-Cylindrotheca_fusiformis.AAC.27